MFTENKNIHKVLLLLYSFFFRAENSIDTLNCLNATERA